MFSLGNKPKKNHRVGPCGQVSVIYSTFHAAEQLLNRLCRQRPERTVGHMSLLLYARDPQDALDSFFPEIQKPLTHIRDRRYAYL
jgi:hypothetical protein